MIIRTVNDSDRTSWDVFVRSHISGTVFHLFAWKEVIEETFQHKCHYLLAQDGAAGSIVGVLPVFEMKSLLFGHSLVSVPFAELGGVLGTNERVERALLNHAIQLGKQIACDYLELKNQKVMDGLATKKLYFNFSKEIAADPEENLLNIPRKSRAMVRKGIKCGLKSETGKHLLPEFYEVLSRSYHSLGTPVFPRAYFRNVLTVFGDAVEILVVHTPEGRAIAGVLTFYYGDRVMPYYAGSLPQYRHLAPNDYMYWELMSRAGKAGFKIFDFGRSKIDTGSFSFKKHWGFEPKPLAYQYHLVKSRDIPNLSPANPKYRRKIEFWRKMPHGLTKILGPPLAKYLG